MIRLTYSNRTEALLTALCRRLEETPREPLAPVRIVTPNRHVERYVELGIARTLGVAANLRFQRLSRFVTDWVAVEGHELLVGDALAARMLFALTDETLLAHPALGPVRRYLFARSQDPDAVDRRRAELTLHLAHLFEEYGFSRPDLLDAWARGERRFEGDPRAATNEAWQAELFLSLLSRGGPTPAWTLRDALRNRGAGPSSTEPLYVFGLSYVARAFAEVFDRLSHEQDLFLYALNPCEEFWEDLETDRERRTRARRGDTSALSWAEDREDPSAISAESESALLTRLGRPGREYVRLLSLLTDCDFDGAFVDPLAEDPATRDLPLFADRAPASILHRIQHDILHRSTDPTRPRVANDESISVLACPSARREVEAVVATIRELVDTLDDLSFDQIAVLVNGPDGERYLPHLESVFEEAGPIPHTLLEVSLASSSPVIEAARSLLALPVSPLGRPELLSLLTHPRIGDPDADPSTLTGLVERLGIFRGLDRASFRGTYVEDEDRLSWDQGLRRIALGAFMDDASFVTVDAHRYLPEVEPLFEGENARFACLVRSLASDVQFARTTTLAICDWVRFMGALLDAYVTTRGAGDEAALARAKTALDELTTFDRGGPPVRYALAHAHGGAPVRYALAHALVEAKLAELTTTPRGALGEGVVVGSLLPMRAIPFRVIFALGLGEGRFPAGERADAMDLRLAQRLPTDVSATERDRYTFLETILSARDRLVLSYVARDEATGDVLAPSVVITELLETLAREHAIDATHLVRRLPLHRHDDPATCRVLPAAAEERAIEALGDDFFSGRERPGARDLARLRFEIRDRPRLAEAVGLITVPEPIVPPTESVGVRTVTTRALRRFLESPLQGFASSVLRLGDGAPLGRLGHGAPLGRLGDEIVSGADAVNGASEVATARESAAVLQSTLHRHALFGAGLEDAYREEVEPRAARGRWPLGAFAELERSQHREVLARWIEGLGALSVVRPLARVRFGHGMAREAVSEVTDALSFDDLSIAGVRTRVELHGVTELLCRETRTSVIAITRHKGGALGRYDELRFALRGFFDHALLSARGSEGGHETVQIYGDGHAPVHGGFGPLSSSSARTWLASVIEDFLSSAHDYVFPIEAIARIADRGDAVDGQALLRSIQAIRERFRGGQSRFGPIRDPERYAPPSEEVALAIFERRFAPWLDASREASR